EVAPAGQEHDLDRHRRDPAPRVLAEEGQRDLGEDVRLDQPPALANPLPGPGHGRVVGRDPAELHGEVRLDRRRQVAGPCLVEVPGPVSRLPLAEVLDGLPLEGPVWRGQEVAEEEILGRDGGVGLELPHPKTGWSLSPKEMILRAADGAVDPGLNHAY